MRQPICYFVARHFKSDASFKPLSRISEPNVKLIDTVGQLGQDRRRISRRRRAHFDNAEQVLIASGDFGDANAQAKLETGRLDQFTRMVDKFLLMWPFFGTFIAQLGEFGEDTVGVVLLNVF